MLTKEDIQQLNEKKIPVSIIETQLQQFADGFPYAQLKKAATINDGIIQIDKDKGLYYCELFEQAINNGLNTTKFVPASGAASRMFKSLFEFMQSDKQQQAELLVKELYQTFFSRINDFAFVNDLKGLFKDEIATPIDVDTADRIIKTILNTDGLNYGSLPKGLLKFHKNSNSVSTPMEEHLNETALYASNNKSGKVHFTVSPEHHQLFSQLLESCIKDFENKHDIKYDVSFSYQKQSTDTIAVNPDNTPFKTSDNKLFFRPGGHGALIENLNDLNDELIFVKNIDNVVPEYLQADTTYNKKLLAGILLEKQKLVANILKGISSDTESVRNEAIDKGIDFLKDDLQIDTSTISASDKAEKIAYINSKLNKPIRICGMVKNEGEAGGGPFWVEQEDGTTSLQVVEGAQIDPNNSEQQKILKESTHFNPVDLVCYVYDHEGNKFDLTQYVNVNTGFISEKTLNGKALKALELPGLWNGAMANWLTFFVEVPISTFNPVKTVMDLLRPQHQPK